MAQKTFYADLNLNGNQLKYGVVHNLASAPANPLPGQIYFNTTTNLFYYYDGATWVTGKSYNFVSVAGGTSLINSFDGTELSLKAIQAGSHAISITEADGVITFDIDTNEVVSAVLGSETFIQDLNSRIALATTAMKNEIMGEAGDTGYTTINGLKNNLNNVEEKVTEQVYSIGMDESTGDVYLVLDVDNTLVDAESSNIDQTTGDVVITLNVE